MTKKRWRQIALALGATLLSLVAVEMGLRIWGYDPIPHASSSSRRLVVPLAGARKYGLRPSFWGRAWRTTLRINSAGFRGPEPRPRGADPRVVVLGDSVAFGLYVREEETFSAVLGEELVQSGRPAEVLNLGIAGYDTLQEVAFLEQVGLGLRPRVVVLQITLNDAEVASPSLDALQRIRLRSQGWLRASRIYQGLLVSFYRQRIKSHHTWANEPRVFREAFAAQIAPISPEERPLLALMERVNRELGKGAIPARYYGDRRRVGRIRFGLDRLKTLALRHGFSVVALVFPLLDQAGEGYPFASAHAVIAHEVRRCGFGLVDLTGDYLKAGMKALRARRRDNVHPNGRGHRLAALALAPEISSLLGPRSR